MKRKILCIVLSAMMIMNVAACGDDSPTNSKQDSVEYSNTESKSNETESEETESNDTGNDASGNEINFEEIVAVDNDECSIKITGIEADNIWGYTLTTALENKSKDKLYMFSVESAAINGVQSDPLFATEVAAGKKSNSEISFSGDSLKENGVEEFTDIELTFRVYDSEDWEAEDVAKETVHVYPLGEDDASVFERKPGESDTILSDNDDVVAIITGYRTDEIWGYTADVYLQNKTDKTVMFSVEDASLNGYMADPFWATSVLPGKCAFSSIQWGSEALEENGISDVEEIEFTFNAYDEESSKDYVSEKITLNP